MAAFPLVMVSAYLLHGFSVSQDGELWFAGGFLSALSLDLCTNPAPNHLCLARLSLPSSCFTAFLLQRGCPAFAGLVLASAEHSTLLGEPSLGALLPLHRP